MKNAHYPFELPQLYFPENALEPAISGQTISFHHGKHFAKYVENLNAILAKFPEYQETCLEQLMCQLDSLPQAIQIGVRNNGGGCLNHDIYFRGLSPKPSTPTGALLDAINQHFGSYEEMKQQLANESIGVFGSGWGWLCYDPKAARLCITGTANQDTPYEKKLYPIVAVDVWEHAYYLDYQNRRPDYVGQMLAHVDWEHACGIYRNIIDGGVDTPF